jgi:predicted transcriptional regulator
LEEINQRRYDTKERLAILSKFENDVRRQYKIAEEMGQAHREDIKGIQDYLAHIGWDQDKST